MSYRGVLYRKRPVTIEAMQWDGELSTAKDIIDWVDSHTSEPMIGWTNETPQRLEVRTLEGDMRVNVGDWVIKGVNGEFYPCKPDIFEKTYEIVENNGHP